MNNEHGFECDGCGAVPEDMVFTTSKEINIQMNHDDSTVVLCESCFDLCIETRETR